VPNPIKLQAADRDCPLHGRGQIHRAEPSHARTDPFEKIVTAMKLPGVTNSLIKSTMFEDNNDAISTATAVKRTSRTKHIVVKYHFFKSHIDAGTGISLSKMNTNLQKADIFTKGLAPQKFVEIRKLLCGW
jgi:hypothetical protein